MDISVRHRSWVGLKEESVIRAFDYGLFVDVPNGICMYPKYLILGMIGTWLTENAAFSRVWGSCRAHVSVIFGSKSAFGRLQGSSRVQYTEISCFLEYFWHG